MRTCAYYPISVVKWDDNRQMIDEPIPDGFEDNFIDLIKYDGEINNEEHTKYEVIIPEIPELNKRTIISRLDQIKESLSTKIV